MPDAADAEREPAVAQDQPPRAKLVPRRSTRPRPLMVSVKQVSSSPLFSHRKLVDALGRRVAWTTGHRIGFTSRQVDDEAHREGRCGALPGAHSGLDGEEKQAQAEELQPPAEGVGGFVIVDEQGFGAAAACLSAPLCGEGSSSPRTQPERSLHRVSTLPQHRHLPSPAPKRCPARRPS